MLSVNIMNMVAAVGTVATDYSVQQTLYNIFLQITTLFDIFLRKKQGRICAVSRRKHPLNIRRGDGESISAGSAMAANILGRIDMKRRIMKRLIYTVSLSLAFCILMAAGALFVGADTNAQTYFKGQDSVYAGDTLTLTFYAGGGILGGSGKLNYDKSTLTLVGQSEIQGGVCSARFSGDSFMFYKNDLAVPMVSASAVFEVSFRVSADAAVGKSFSITAQDLTFSDGERDIDGASTSHSVRVARTPSGVCKLSSLSVGDAVLTPEFSPSVTEYSAQIGYEIAEAQLFAVAADGYATVAISSAAVEAGETRAVFVTVTAENGNKCTYTVNITRAKSTNPALSSLIIAEYTLSPEFSPEVLSYKVTTDTPDLVPTVEAVALHGHSSVSVGEYVPPHNGADGRIDVTVTAQDGTVRVYEIIISPSETAIDTAVTDTAEITDDLTDSPETEDSSANTQEEPITPPQSSDTQSAHSRYAYMLAVSAVSAVSCVAEVFVYLYLRHRKKNHPSPEDPSPEDPSPEDPLPEDPSPEDPSPEDPLPEDPSPEDPSPEDPEPDTAAESEGI